MTATADLLRVARAADPGTLPSETDGDLLRRYADTRDETAFAELVRRNGPAVLRTCRSVLGEATAAEDVFQAVFLDLARKARQFTRPGSAAGWLHAAAVRAARAARRADARRRRREQVAGAIAGASPDDLSWREVREVLDAELAALPEQYRVPLVLCYLQGLTYEEAARRAGCPVGALRGRLERGKERLRKRLARYGLPLGAPVLVLGRPPAISAELAAATTSAARVGVPGGPVPAVVAGLIGVGYRLRTAWVVPALVAGVILAAGLLPAEPPRTDPPPAPPPRAAADPPPRADRFGDPLPDGVLARLGTTRCRVNVFAFGIERDGTVVTITGGRDGVVQTWGPGDDRPRTTTPVTLAGPPGTFPCVDISPDGRYVAGSTPTRIVVQERRKDGPAEVALFDLGRRWRTAFSPDGTKLAVAIEGEKGQKVSVCNIPTRTTAGLEGSGRSFESLAFSGDGTRLAAVDGSNVLLWDVPTGRRLAQHTPGSDSWYAAVALDRTGGIMAVIPAVANGTVFFVDPKTNKRIEGLTGPPVENASWVRYAPDGRTILVGSWTGVRWWDPAAGKLIRAFEGSTWYWGSGRLSPDGKILVSHTERMLLRWDATTGKPLFPGAHDGGHQECVAGLSVLPGGKTVATAGGDGRVRTWDAATGRPLRSFPAPAGNNPEVPVSPDGQFLYTPGISPGGPVKWDVGTGKEVLRYALDPAESIETQAEAVRVSPDGMTLLAFCSPSDYGEQALLMTWDAVTGKRLRTIRLGERRRFRSGTAVLSPDGRWLVIGAGLFSVGAGADADRLARPDRGGDTAPPAAFSSDSRLVAVARLALDRPGRPVLPAVYEVATGATVLELPPEAGGWMTFHPDGRTLAAASPTGLSFWDLAAGKEYANRKTPLVGGSPLRYFPDGSRLLTAAPDTTALVWAAPTRPKQPKPLPDPARAAAWEALASPDGAKGWAAVWALADDPGAVGFLRGKMRPEEPLPAAEFRQLLVDLGAGAFDTREKARKQLRAAGERAVPPLREALKAELSEEQRRAVDQLLREAPGAGRRPPTGKRLRVIRAVAALELSGTPEARKLLATLADGMAEATVTWEASMAVERAGR